MRKEVATERIHVGSLAELDAVVGKHLVGEVPRTHWEDSQTHFLFDSMEEAIDAMQDPYFRQFVQRPDAAPTVLNEIKEFRHYSRDLNATWEVVEKLGAAIDALVIQRVDGRWAAAFGGCEQIVARSVPVAICLAALRSRGMEVDCDLDSLERSRAAASGVANAQVHSYYSRP